MIVAAALSVGSAAALAQSNVAVYGNLDQYLGYIHSSSGNSITGLNDGAVFRSRLGFRGAEDLGGGTQLKFTLEQGFSGDTGAQADATRLFDRQAWLGVAGSYGDLRVGRQNTAVFLVGSGNDYTERSTFGSVLNTFGIPTRFDNDISYRTVRMSGVQVELHYALPENGGATKGNRAILQLGVDYTLGDYRVGYAGLSATPNQVTATVQEKVVFHNLYGAYKYGQGTLYLGFERSNNPTANANGRTAATLISNISNPNNFFPGTDANARRFFNVSQVSADYRLSAALRVGALYGVIRDTSGGNAGAKGGNAGAYYDLSKRTLLYGFANWMKNEANGGFRFSGSGAPSANLAGADINGKTLTGLQAGIVHRF